MAVSQADQDLRFSVKAGDKVIHFRELGSKNLDRPDFIEQCVAGFVNLGHSAFSNTLQDVVLAQAFPDQGIFCGQWNRVRFTHDVRWRFVQ
jgi:hypothetical protein